MELIWFTQKKSSVSRFLPPVSYSRFPYFLDYKLIRTVRRVNKGLGTTDFIDPSDGSLVFRTCPEERDRVILQIGTACPKRALKVGKIVENDVAGIDINMGCPKEFSVKGGMGAALLDNREVAKDILRTLVENLKIPVTCKIRVLFNVEDTVELAKDFANTGISAIGVHGRNRDERPHNPVRPDFIRAVAESLDIPVIANGGSREILKWEDINRFKDECGASSVMIARAAEWNVSIFRHEMLPMEEVICEYLKLSVQFDNPANNTKYCVQNILRDLQESPMGRRFLDAQTLEQICDVWGLAEYCRETLNRQRSSGNVDRRQLSMDDLPTKKLKLDDDIISHNLAFIRSNYAADFDLPKSKLYNYATKSSKKCGKYEILQQQKLFRAILTYDGKRYTSSFWEKNKRHAEQGAALSCLFHLDLVDQETLIKNESLILNR